MEELNYNMLFRWFVGLNMDDRVWDATTFTKNRERLLRGGIAEVFFLGVVDEARGHELLSDEHITVDGTLLEAAASLKSFKSKDQQDEPPADDPGNPTVNFHGQKRSNETHQSTTDPDSMLCRKGKGKEAKLGYAGHLLMENRNGLAVSACVTPATGTAERDAALDFAEEMSGNGISILSISMSKWTIFDKKKKKRECAPKLSQRWSKGDIVFRCPHSSPLNFPGGVKRVGGSPPEGDAGLQKHPGSFDRLFVVFQQLVNELVVYGHLFSSPNLNRLGAR